MVGRALERVCAGRADVEFDVRLAEPDFEDREAVRRWFEASSPEWVVVAAGESGGIARNQREPATLMQNNLLVAAHCLEAAHRVGVERLLYLASSCAYPRDATQPMWPGQLMTGTLEPTSEGFATARLAGLVLCRAYRRQFGARFIGAIPADVYGPGEDLPPEDSHVVAGMLRRMHEAKAAKAPVFHVWGSGRPRRDFIFVDDLAEACLIALARYEGDEPINLGSNAETSIRDLAEAVRRVVGYEGTLLFDTSRPDGTPVKALDAGVAAGLGFVARFNLHEGLSRAHEDLLRSSDPASVTPASISDGRS